MKVKISDFIFWGLGAIIIASENFLYILDGSIGIVGPITLSDLFLGIALIWATWVMYRYQKYPTPKHSFGVLVIVGLALVLISSIQAQRLYGQNIALGIRPQRTWIVQLILYFPISKLLYNNIISLKKLKRFIIGLGTVEIVLYLAQYFIGNSLIFLNANRHAAGAFVGAYDSDRYYFNTIFLCFVLFIILNELFKKKHIVRNLIHIGLILLIIAVVCKMRMNFLSVTLSIGIGILLWRRGGSVKLAVLAGIIIVAAFFTQLEMVQSLISVLTGKSTSATLEIRGVGRIFYLGVLSQHPIAGGGYINTQWGPSYIASRMSEGLLVVDNGIFGFLYLYGGLGIAWVILWFIKIYKKATPLRVKTNNYIYFVMPLYWLISCVTEAPWYFNSFMVMILFVCMMEKEYSDMQKNFEYSLQIKSQ